MYHNMNHEGVQADPPLDIEGLLYEMAMARSTMAAQIGNGSSMHRQRPTRVMKSSSTSNSPQQHLQRRRTSATQHNAMKYRSSTYQQTFQSLFGNDGASHNQSVASHATAAPRARPMSWHPSTIGSSTNWQSNFQPNMTYQSIIPCYQETVAVNGLPTPMTRPDLKEDLPLGMHFSSLDDSARSAFEDEQPRSDLYSYHQGALSLNTDYQSIPPMYQDPEYVTSAIDGSDAHQMFSSNMLANSAWLQLQQVSSFTAPPTPDLLPIQKSHEPEIPQLERKDSNELIGMGLYDNSDRHGVSEMSIAGSYTPGSRASAVGKGLKLEETWEPPEDDSDSDEEEEEEEGEEDDCNETSREEVEGETKLESAKVQKVASQHHTTKYAAETFTHHEETTGAYHQSFSGMADTTFYRNSCDSTFATWQNMQSSGKMDYTDHQSLMMGGASTWL